MVHLVRPGFGRGLIWHTVVARVCATRRVRAVICRIQRPAVSHKLVEQILVTVNELLPSKGLLFAAGTVVDASLIAAPISTKNKDRIRNSDMHSSKKGSQGYFGMKSHIGADAASGLVHPLRVAAEHVGDIVE